MRHRGATHSTRPRQCVTSHPVAALGIGDVQLSRISPPLRALTERSMRLNRRATVSRIRCPLRSAVCCESVTALRSDASTPEKMSEWRRHRMSSGRARYTQARCAGKSQMGLDHCVVPPAYHPLVRGGGLLVAASCASANESGCPAGIGGCALERSTSCAPRAGGDARERCGETVARLASQVECSEPGASPRMRGESEWIIEPRPPTYVRAPDVSVPARVRSRSSSG